MVGKVLCEREKSLVTHTGAASTMNTTNFPIWVSGAATFRFDDINFAFDNTPITTSYTYNSANELVSTSQGGAATSFAYDAWGRQTSKTRGSSSAAYAYRYGDKLYSVTSNFPGEGNVTYNYGGDGKRRERTAAGVTTRYNWDVGWNVISEENTSGALTNTYIHDPSRFIGTILADVSGSNPATGAYRYYSQDNLGSTRRLRDQNKASLGQYEYEPYGANYAEIGPVITRKFTGHTWDPAAQLYFAPYRYYAPSLARWLTRDPLGMVDGPNVYAYVMANPVSKVDPLGLTWIPCCGGYLPPPPPSRSSCLDTALSIADSATGATTSIRHCVAVCEIRKCYGDLVGGLAEIINVLIEYFATSPSDDWYDDILAGEDGMRVDFSCKGVDCTKACRNMHW